MADRKLALPRMVGVRQEFDRVQVADIRAAVQRQFQQPWLKDHLGTGSSVAITAGSRGVANFAEILGACVDEVRACGGEPFLFPAMGSHGGGTAEGQLEVLAGYGVTEATCGCPIRASMETVEVFATRHGFSVHVDRHAYEADQILVVNRVKPHTMFVGPIESGLCKMMLIGMGKKAGAEAYHGAILTHSFAELIDAAIPRILRELPILGGLAIVENAYEQTAAIELIRAAEILSEEPRLLDRARSLMARLPLNEIDVLIIDEMGKNISGTGIDTNIVGRKFDDNKAVAGELPKVLRIVARSLTPESHGNATGIGITDFITQRLADAIDVPKTRVNCVTSGHIGAGKIPPVYANDREAIAAAVSCIGLRPLRDARIVRIKNTLELIDLAVSEPCLPELKPNAEVVTESYPLRFAVDGSLA